jgi:hypothetical protein
MKKLFVAFTLLAGSLSAQELTAIKDCHDTLAFSSYKTINLPIFNSACSLSNGKNQQYYFTSNKELPGFNGDQNCFAQSNSYDLKKHNILVLEYDYKTTKVSTEIKAKDGKVVVLVRVIKPKGNLDLLIPKPYHKYIEIPKELCKEKPKVFICETYN